MVILRHLRVRPSLTIVHGRSRPHLPARGGVENLSHSDFELLPAHELWVETHSEHLLPGPNGLEVHSNRHLLPGLDGLETDCRPKAFTNSLDLVIACPTYVLSGAWKLQLPRNHTREALYSPRRASSVGLTAVHSAKALKPMLCEAYYS